MKRAPATLDSRRRLSLAKVLPHAKPGDVFRIETEPEGRIILTRMVVVRKEEQ